MSNAVVVCTWGEERDGLPSNAEEVLTLGSKVSKAVGSELHWLNLGPLAPNVSETAGRYGVAALQHIDDAKLASFQADPTVEALAQYCAANAPRLVLFAQTQQARTAAPRLAGRLGAAVVMNGTDFEVEGGKLNVVATAYGGDTRSVYELQRDAGNIVAIAQNTVTAEPGEGGAVEPQAVSVDLSSVEERIKVVQEARTEGPRLEDASIIVSGGRGLSSVDNYKLIEQLAEALGGMPGASRPLVDEGWVDSAHQVGLTGRITRPALYMAFGISGASQHMAGCSAATTLVAVNTDEDAAIFQHAKYGIVGDCLEILPELIKAAGR